VRTWRVEWLGDKALLGVGALVFVAYCLRLLRLDYQPLWWDEGWTLYFATAEIPAMMARTAIDIHPPFYYSILHFWTMLAGSSVFVVRYLSVVVGTLSVALVYPVARRLFGRTAGIVGALVMALAPFHVYYSQEGRMYALVAMLSLASIFTFLRLLEGGRKQRPAWRLWAIYVALTYLAILTQYYAAFVPVALTVFMLSRWRRYGAMLGKWLAAHGVVLLLYVPWLYYAGPKLVDYVANKLVKEGDAPVGLLTYFRNHLLAFSVGHPQGQWSPLAWLAVVPVTLAGLAIVVHLATRCEDRQEGMGKREAILFVLIYLFVPLSLGYIVNLRYPFTSPSIERLFLLSAPGLFLLVAAGLAWLRERVKVPWAALFLIVAVVDAPLLVEFYAADRYPGDDYRPLIDAVQGLARTEDVIVAVHPWQLGYFQAYYRGQLPLLYLTPKEATDVTSEMWAEDRDLMERDLSDLLSAHRFLWFLSHQALGRIIEEDVDAYLFAQSYAVLNRWHGESTRLTCFSGADDQRRVERRVDFGGKVSLNGYGLSPSMVEAAWGAVRVDLEWTVDEELPSKYQMVFQLVDQQGRAWAVEDREPLGGLRPFREQPAGSEIRDRQAVLIPAGTAPGRYDLKLGLYRLDTGEWLEVRDRDGSPLGVEMVLDAVEVRVPDALPSETALAVQEPRAVDFAPGIRFLGFSVGSGTFRPGDTLEFSLFWKALQDVQGDYNFVLMLKDGGGQTWAEVSGPLASSAYPTNHWGRGQLARGIHPLTIPAGVPPGRYNLVIGLRNAEDGAPVPIQRWLLNWGDEYLLGMVHVEGREHQTNPPASITYPTRARLGAGIELLGYELDRAQVEAGGSLRLTLYWQALQDGEGSYSVFNHLIDNEGRIWGQKDGVPGGGILPTGGWIAGEYITDEYVIPVKEEAPPRECLIETGMYDPQTMRRLPVFDVDGTSIGDRVLLTATPIQVR
jgi:4-amino-4-deoxy-L-arabinose transferase-like glycosyltransferase